MLGSHMVTYVCTVVQAEFPSWVYMTFGVCEWIYFPVGCLSIPNETLLYIPGSDGDCALGCWFDPLGASAWGTGAGVGRRRHSCRHLHPAAWRAGSGRGDGGGGGSGTHSQQPCPVAQAGSVLVTLSVDCAPSDFFFLGGGSLRNG